MAKNHTGFIDRLIEKLFVFIGCVYKDFIIIAKRQREVGHLGYQHYENLKSYKIQVYIEIRKKILFTFSKKKT